MDIYPQDLGRAACQQVQRQRLWSATGETTDRPVPSPTRVTVARKRTPLRVFIFWSLAVALSASFVLPLEFPLIALVCVTCAVLWHQSVSSSGRVSTEFRRPRSQWACPDDAAERSARLTVKEVGALHAACADPLLGKYWELVVTALTLPTSAEGRAETERSVREALRALGSALENVPARTLDGVPDDPRDLQATAARMAADAQRETDPVVAASLCRRAEAMQRQAETVARVGVILRRNQALRAEIGDQIGALRTSLTASMLGQDQAGPELADLAAYIQQVAREADAITQARVEVDTLLHQPHANALVIPVEGLRQGGG